MLGPRLGRARVLVNNGKVRNVIYLGRDWENFVPTHGGFGEPLVPTTIPNWFSFIERRIRSQPPDRLTTEYDLVDGHPLRFREDDPATKQLEMEVRIENFKRR